MANVLAAFWLNLPNHVSGGVFLVGAIWLVAVPRQRSRAAVWAAVALLGYALIDSVFLIHVAAGMAVTRPYLLAVNIAGCGLLGLLFAAVMVDRRHEVGGG